jgi:C4-dicarboxylate-specific signal transduction histidine kinase
MTTTTDLTGWTGLQFFGRTTASVSHELKNALAIIKENAGLLNDYLLMAEKGTPLKPERLKIVADRIDQQTRRADTLIKHLNRFGHSIDEPLTTVDLNDVVSLLAALTQREVSMKQATLQLAMGELPMMVKTAPFWLLTFLGHCMTFSLKVLGPEKVLHLQVEKVEDGTRILFSPLSRLQGADQADFPGEAEMALLKSLDAACHIDPDAGTLLVNLSNR